MLPPATETLGDRIGRSTRTPIPLPFAQYDAASLGTWMNGCGHGLHSWALFQVVTVVAKLIEMVERVAATARPRSVGTVSGMPVT